MKNLKNIILGMVFVFGMSFTVGANESTLLPQTDCGNDAWDVGTELGNGNPFWEYFWTDFYFTSYCNDDGTYRYE